MQNIMIGALTEIRKRIKSPHNITQDGEHNNVLVFELNDTYTYFTINVNLSKFIFSVETNHFNHTLISDYEIKDNYYTVSLAICGIVSIINCIEVTKSNINN